MTKKLLFIFILLHSFLMNASARQGNYRWRNDDGNQTASTWKAATNAATLVGAVNQPLRLRMEIYNSSTSGSGSFNLSPLQYRKNGGAWTSITSSTANDFYFINSVFVTNNTGTTQQISTGSFTGGFFKSDNSNNNISLSTTTRTEIEFCISRSSNYDIYSTYQFQIASLTSYDRYPTLNPICSTPKPTVNSNVVYNLNQQALPLTAVGTNLFWYTTPTGGTGSTTAPTPLTNTVGTTSYYVSQNTGCEGPRAEIKVLVKPLSSTGKSLHFDGVDDYVKVSTFDFAVSNNFTMDLWVKPEKAITLPTEATAGITGSTGQSYPLFPTLVGAYGVDDATHSGAGVSVGTNGICVFEHAGGYLPALLVHPVAISGWTRVTVVYTNKQPSLYINGVLVKTGLTSPRSFVHPPLRDIGNSDFGTHNTYGPYQGSIDRIYILNNSVIPNATCEPAPNDSNVIASYFFDQGVAGANNSTINYLIDNGERYSGELLNFALNGATSNWIADTPSVTLPAPPVASDHTFCTSATVANLIPAPSATINWYSQAIGGTALASSTALATGFYYVDFTDSNGCKSTRTKIIVRQSNNSAPIVTSPVIYNQGDTAAALTATGSGTGLLWYTTATGGIGSTTAPTPSTATVGTVSYYVSSTEFSCESTRSQIVVIVNSTTPATHLNFDGVNDIVNCGNTLNSVLDPLNTITVETWVKPSTNTGLGVIVGNYANPTGGNMQFLMRRDNANYTFWISGTPGVFKNVTASNAVLVNTWQHIAGVWNGSDLKIYINGVLAGTTTGVTESSFATTTNNLMIGNNQAASPERFTGNIDEVRIWTNVRTAEQINGSKNCELQGTETGLIAYYKFNQGFDASNNVAITTLTASTGPNGTLTNFTLTAATSNWLAGSPVTTGSIIPSVATVTTPVVYTQGSTASALTATTGTNGTGLLWYTTASGGVGSASAPTPSTATVGNTSYWVSSTNANGCESARVEIVVTVNAPAPATHLNFDGIDDVVDLGSGLTTYFTGKTKVTIQAWVRSETNSGLGTIVGNYNYPTNNNSMQMMLRRDGANYAFWLDSGSGYTSVSAVGSVVLNTWQHVTGTWDGTTMRIYIDGILANSSAKTGVIPSRTTSFSIGSNTSERFDGDIDEVKLWDMALTATDIMNTMNCEAQTQPELVAYYKFNQGNDIVNNSSVTSLLDSSSNANNGILTSFALTGATSNWRSGSTITTGNTCATLGNSDFDNVTRITIYPNPSTGIFNIVSQQVIAVEIYDLLGKLVYNQQLVSGTNSIDISNINTGVYLLKATDANGNSESHKLIKN